MTRERFVEQLTKLRELVEQKVEIFGEIMGHELTEFQRRHIKNYMFGTIVESYGKGIQEGVAARIKQINEKAAEEESK